MPRRPRDYQPDVAYHVRQRGNNRQRCFFETRDYLRYLAYLDEASREHACAIHAYVLMTNHVHLLVTPASEAGISQMMQSLGRCYVQHINRRRERTGTLWEGRHKASAVDTDAYWYVCARYIELNPVRAGMVSVPTAYRWSSYRANAQGASDSLLKPHELYEVLGNDDAARRQAWQQLCNEPLCDADLSLVREAAQRGISMKRLADLKIQQLASTTPTPPAPPTGRR